MICMILNTEDDPIDKRDLMPYTFPDVQDLQKLDIALFR